VAVQGTTGCAHSRCLRERRWWRRSRIRPFESDGVVKGA
jgi:hypothetical protein